MFALTHIYCSKKINSGCSSLFLYGSIFPDIPATGLVGWEVFKKKTEGFSKFIKNKYPKLSDFANGLLVHEEPYGIDRFVHGENGFANIYGRKTESNFANFFPKELQLITAHLFIEFAVETLLIRKYPSLLEEALNVQNVAKRNIEPVSIAFSEFFNKDLGATKAAILIFNKTFYCGDNIEKDTGLALKDYIEKTRKSDLSEKDFKKLVSVSIGSIPTQYLPFLENTIKKCKVDFSNNKAKLL